VRPPPTVLKARPPTFTSENDEDEREYDEEEDMPPTFTRDNDNDEREYDEQEDDGLCEYERNDAASTKRMKGVRITVSINVLRWVQATSPSMHHQAMRSSMRIAEKGRIRRSRSMRRRPGWSSTNRILRPAQRIVQGGV
jgi:hypothetical protein